MKLPFEAGPVVVGIARRTVGTRRERPRPIGRLGTLRVLALVGVAIEPCARCVGEII